MGTEANGLFFGRWKMKAFQSDGSYFLHEAMLTSDGESSEYFNKFKPRGTNKRKKNPNPSPILFSLCDSGS